jgi:hypothetical protein
MLSIGVEGGGKRHRCPRRRAAARARALAQERNVPPADIAKLMYKRINTRDVMAFCEKHRVSYDWLLCGDLGGLRRMMREHKAQAGGPNDKWVMFLRAALEAIPPTCVTTPSRAPGRLGSSHEAPAPIGQEAQPAADSCARKADEAMKGFLTIPG